MCLGYGQGMKDSQGEIPGYFMRKREKYARQTIKQNITKINKQKPGPF